MNLALIASDPLYNILFILFVVLLISFSMQGFELFKSYLQRKSMLNFVSDFAVKNIDDETLKTLDFNVHSLESFLLLASEYFNNADYQNAISIYQALLKHFKNKEQNNKILLLLGECYHKVGFLERSKAMYIESLKLKSRNEEALTKLLILYEQRQEYQEAMQILPSLEELGADLEVEQEFLSALAAIKSRDKAKLEQMLSSKTAATRIILEYFFKYHSQEAWQYIHKINPLAILDILWQLKIHEVDLNLVQNQRLLKEIFTAKGFLAAGQTQMSSDHFELSVLLNLEDKNLANIDFEYACGTCKQLSPVYSHRCINCFKVNTLEPKAFLVRNDKVSKSKEVLTF